MSFYREYFYSGDSRWAELAADLARHVIDIDINHTYQDREEYCNGLFWHTDHYLDVYLSTHRSVSKEHLKKKNPAFVGGGPGAEHCYTTGLLQHYNLTGDSRFREIVLRLADWCTLSLTGPLAIFAVLLRAKKTITYWIKNRKNDVIWSRYPLSRGTGNCLNSCLDAFEISGWRRYLDRANQLIKGTVHPNDDVEKRNLLDAEVAWSYTVFLVAVAKFLQKKQELDECDEDFCYAQDTLLKYACWMLEHEYPFLKKKEILEFPNETWAAQDLRKSVIFYHAAKYAPSSQQQAFLEKAQEFVHTSFSELDSWDSRYYTRPLVLILQNGWVEEKLSAKLPAQETTQMQWPQSPHKCNAYTALKRIASDFTNVLPKTGIKREWS